MTNSLLTTLLVILTLGIQTITCVHIDEIYGASSHKPFNTQGHGKDSLSDVWGQEWPFQGIETFAHLPHEKCLLNRTLDFDIGIIGVPFDTATTYRPGVRFGPNGIRKGSLRQSSMRGFNFRAGINPYKNWAKIIDCGDIPVTPMDNWLALKQMSAAYENLIINRPSTFEGEQEDDNKKSGGTLKNPPRLISLGGDHSILLPILRTMNKVYGGDQIQIIHFDSHLDTWAPSKFPSYWSSNITDFNHGSMLWLAYHEGLISKKGNVHVGLRTRISGTDYDDYMDDDSVGFKRIHADDIMTMGPQGIVDSILETIDPSKPVYISVDIDVIDPSAAPGTGTMECGGFLTRELIYMLRRLDHLQIIGADIVEVSPPYDPLEITALAGAQVAYELLTSMVKKGPIDKDLIDMDRINNIEMMSIQDVIGSSNDNNNNNIINNRYPL